MFTGIVEATGTIQTITTTDDGQRLRINAPFVHDLEPGQSVNVSGVCLTVEATTDQGFEVFLATETIDRTYLGRLAEGHPVNLERAMPASGRFDGHLVQGHVDTTTRIQSITPVGEDYVFEFALPTTLRRYFVPKGSIALDGISLTIATINSDTFTVAIIPATYTTTTLAGKHPGDPVHVEADMIAKYLEGLLEHRR